MNENEESLKQQFNIHLDVLAFKTNYRPESFLLKEPLKGRVYYTSTHNQRSRILGSVLSIGFSFLLFYLCFSQNDYFKDLELTILAIIGGAVFLGFGIWLLKTANIEYQIEVNLPNLCVTKRFTNTHMSSIKINFKDFYGLVALDDRTHYVEDSSDYIYALFGLSKKGVWYQLITFNNERHMDEFVEKLSEFIDIPIRKGVGNIPR